jgi:hypothetical protein
VTGDWRKLYNTEIYDISSSTIITRLTKSRKEMGRAFSKPGEKRNTQ